jgi:two-component system response regulator YesN
MYNIIVVDDEKMIREGLAGLIEDETTGFHLMGTAGSGKEALKLVLKGAPDVVITDIKMPVMDGITLIAKIKELCPNMEFIIISGFGEFEYASQAMSFGVRHYLLKPCSERAVMEVLEEVKLDLDAKSSREQFMENNKKALNKVLPLVKEQFLRDLLTAKPYSQEEIQYYSQLLQLDTGDYQGLLLQPEERKGYEELLALSSLSKNHLAFMDIRLCTILKNHVVIIITPQKGNRLLTALKQILLEYRTLFSTELTIAVSESGSLQKLSSIYKQVQDCVRSTFYLGEKGIITWKDLNLSIGDNLKETVIDPSHIVAAVKSGNETELDSELASFFGTFELSIMDIRRVETYCVELLMSIIRQADAEMLAKYIAYPVQILSMNKLEQIESFVREIAQEITRDNYEKLIQRHHKTVREILVHVDAQLGNEELSLKWIASELMYVNVGYLSRLFNHEMGENFPNFVTRLRMEKAKQLLEKNGEETIYELAENIGYGRNPQYFSQVFKKYTGVSPSEYKRSSMKA